MMMKRLILCASCLLVLFMSVSVNATNHSPVSDSKGTNFVIGFTPNYFGNSLSLHISSDTNTQGTVEIPGLAFVQPFTVLANEVTIVDIPVEANGMPSGEISNNGIIVTSNDDVTVYALNNRTVTTDAFMALPVDTLGVEYIVVSYNTSQSVPSQALIVAAYDNTEVTIIPATSTVEGNAAGVPFSVNLNRGETYYVSGYPDLTGSLISSSSPISVVSGVQCVNIPNGYNACDHIVEMLPPVSTWGTTFLTVPLASRLRGDVFRILASRDNTVITVNDVDVATINRGEFYEGIILERSYITSTEPVMVAQYSTSQSFGGGPADPFMMLVPPGEQFLNSYSFTSVLPNLAAARFWRHFVNIVVQTASIGEIILDGVSVDPALFIPIGNTEFSGAQVPLQEGSHNITSNIEFGIFVYGFGTFESYGYPGGMAFELINPQGDVYPPNVRLIETNGVIQGTANDTEDLNLNNILDAGEDLNANGIIDPRTEDINANRILDAGEDLNNNSLLDRDTGIFSVELESGVVNLQLQTTPFIPGSSQVEFSVSRIDSSLPAQGVLVISDGVGNRVTRNIQLNDSSSVLNNVRIISTLSSDQIDLDNTTFTVQPFSTSVVNGDTVIEWRFAQFDIGQTQDLAFDVYLRNPVAGETRQVTQKLDLYFTDINGNEIRTQLGSQSVEVRSSIHTIMVNTDRNRYTIDETVLINGIVTSLSTFPSTTNINLTVRDSQGTLVSDLGQYPDTSLIAGGSFTLPVTPFFTGRYYEGMYSIQAELSDSDGQVYARATSPFVIGSPADIQITGSVSTDKPAYQPYETSKVQARIRNVAPNVILENMTATTTLLGPGGMVIWTENGNLPQLLPNTLRDLNYDVPLGRALAGAYTLRLVIRDNQGIERAMSESTFAVLSTAQTGAGIAGVISTTPTNVLQSETLTIAATINNRGNANLQNLPVTLSIIDPANEQIIQQWTQTTATLATQSEFELSQNWLVTGPVGATYVAVLTADVAGNTQTLAQDSFVIGEKFATQISAGEKGRLLVWLSDGAPEHVDDHEHYHDDPEEHDDHEPVVTTPTLQEQQANLQARLQAAGWQQVTIVNTEFDFVNELHHGGYSLYALLGGEIELNDELEHELTEAVNRGEGLLIAANVEDSPEEALGLDDEESHTASGVTLLESPLHDGGQLIFSQPLSVLAADLEGAELAGSFALLTHSEDDDEHEHHDASETHGDAAVARYAYGAGRSVFVGFDLLNEAVATGNTDNGFTTLLLKALDDVNPETLPYNEGLAVPVTLTITNQGTATTGQVTINLPAGSEVLDNGGAQQVPQANNATNLIWPFTLANNATGVLTFWLQLPQDQSLALIRAAIESNTGGTPILHTPATLSVSITLPPSLGDIISELSPLSGLDSDYAEALSEIQQAQTALVNGNILAAHLNLLEAAEELGEEADEDNRPEPDKAKDIRTKLDGLIRKMAFGL